MARRSFDDETLAWVREMPLSQVLDKLRDDGQLFWRRDPDFVPEKDKRTVRLFLSSPSGFAWEVLVTGLKGVVCGRGRNPTLRLWPTIFSGKIDVFPGDRRSRLISSMTSVAPA